MKDPEPGIPPDDNTPKLSVRAVVEAVKAIVRRRTSPKVEPKAVISIVAQKPYVTPVGAAKRVVDIAFKDNQNEVVKIQFPRR